MTPTERAEAVLSELRNIAKHDYEAKAAVIAKAIEAAIDDAINEYKADQQMAETIRGQS